MLSSVLLKGLSANMKKLTPIRLIVVISVVLIASLVLAACDSPEPRIPVVYTFNPGAPFSTNINDDDVRRQIKCSVIFEVIDEAAIEELAEHGFVIRNAVIAVLGALTMEECTVERDLDEIAQRLVERVNTDVLSHIDLIVGAYFTDFVLT